MGIMEERNRCWGDGLMRAEDELVINSRASAAVAATAAAMVNMTPGDSRSSNICNSILNNSYIVMVVSTTFESPTASVATFSTSATA